MGVRLVRYNRSNNGSGGSSTAYDHDELINRDLMNQHPIYAITGLQEVLNILEDSITDTNELIIEKERVINERIDNIILDIEAINKQLDDIVETIKNLNVINSVIDTYSVDLDYNTTTKALKADVKIYKDKADTNAIQSLATGLYVPKTMTEDTNTITWSVKSIGESMKEIFDGGIRFSHNSNSWSNLYSPNEANAWYWNDSLNSAVQPQNTGYFNGMVTANLYDYYTHIVTLKSSDSDDDLNGVVIGFVFDENNNPHTLSAVFTRGGVGPGYYGLVYDYMLPDQQTLFTSGNGSGGIIPPGSGSGGWNGRPNGITVKITKINNLVTVTTSAWNSTTINEATKISIDLNNYSWGYLFKNAVRYGYCNYSQASSYFQDISFVSDNSASSSKLLATVILSKDSTNALSIKDDGLYAESFKISKDSGNSLIKKTDGYYVEGLAISKKSDNSLEKLSDGLYVRDESNTKTVMQSSHNFVEGDFIFYHPGGEYKKARALDDYDSNIVGMVSKVIDINNFEYKWSGFHATNLFNTANGFTQGMPVYISDIISGKVIQEQPDISKAVGYPIEDIGIIISIERGIQYNQEAAVGDFKQSANDYNVRSDGFIRVIEDVDYKQTLIERLLNTLDDVFKAKYLVYNNTEQTVRFQNTIELYESNKVPDGINLFIKAF